MNSDLVRWPRLLSAIIVIIWGAFLLAGTASSGWGSLLLSALLGVLLYAMSAVGALAGIGFFVAAVMQRDHAALVWSLVLVVVSSIPIVLTLNTASPRAPAPTLA